MDSFTEKMAGGWLVLTASRQVGEHVLSRQARLLPNSAGDVSSVQLDYARRHLTALLDADEARL